MSSLPKPEGDCLGEVMDTGQPVSLSSADLARHAYILGSTGCGKTSLILKLIERDLKAGHSLVVLDLRGDLAAGSLALCECLEIPSDRVTLLDLREQKRVQGFNPLGGAGEPYIRALHMLDVIAVEAQSWGVQLEETLRSALLVLAHAGEPLTKLEALFYDASFRGSALNKCADEQLLNFWDRYGSMSPERQQAWALPVLNKVTSLLAVPVLRAVLSGEPKLDLCGLLNRRGSVLLVSLAVDELHRSARMLGSLLVSAIAREMMARVNVSERGRNPVRLYVDEFENMASESFEGLIAEGRRFGLTLVLSHQTLSQLPAKLRSVIRNNVGIQLLFQCGFEDARDVAKELPEGFDLELLRSLSVGEAILMYRDGTAEHVAFSAPRKLPTASRVREYRDKVLPGVEPDPVQAPFTPKKPNKKRATSVNTEDLL